MNTISIKNDFLTVKINTAGAQIESVKSKSGTEFMWSADPDVWGHSAPILFPICGALKNDSYILDGKSYNLTKHGFVRRAPFEVKSLEDTRAVLAIKDTEETKKVYPYEFEFEAVFELEENSLKVSYNVKNNSDKTMYYSVGCHEAYACPEGIEEYDVEFPKECDFVNYLTEGPLISGKTELFMKGEKVIPLKVKYFEVDSLVFKNLGVHSACLKHKNSDKKITIDFPGFEYFLFWQMAGAKYICLEPWKGFPDHKDTDGDFTKKDGILTVEPGKTDTSVHTIKFEG